jgi:endonuclease/exonuclease/phosphatase family metal-dependent hydrolase
VVRLVSANAASGRDRGRHDFAAWARRAAALDADVYAVQEVDHRLPRSGAEDQAAALAEACRRPGETWSHHFTAAILGTPGSRDTFRPATATALGEHEGAYGVALVTRFPVVRTHELRMEGSRVSIPMPLPPGAEHRVLWVPDEPRAALAAELTTPSGPLTVVCTHLSFEPIRAGRQLRELTGWAGALPGPVVLLGDLNMPPGVAAMLSRWTPLARHPTYPASNPRVQLDHALAGPGSGVRVTSSRAEVVGASDHRALVVDVRLAAG